ncbi:type II secretion system major pseudopilin GspG [Sulfurimonas sp.]|uniref:type II secretion system major pseudopilin GspG n=1 Tax=Sulfurimonas sp. TaxID=2022749 RepID=UPI002B461E7F|nr:type II secretion system major pseudopilin GspG [Sulfurimonas sp.]
MQRKAFSLIELMIVIVILGLLAAMVMPSLTSKGEKAKKNLVCIQMQRIYNNALDMYKVDNSLYPSTEEGLELLAEKDYFKDKKLPKDSWGNPFIYLNNSGSVELVSLGADKKEGGEDSASDIKMSECN